MTDPEALPAAHQANLAMDDIVRLHYESIHRFCSRFVGCDRADDATQVTFVTAHRRLPGFRGESSLKTWLTGIALNVCRNQLRKARTLPLEGWQYPAGADPTDQLISAESLRAAIARLSDEHREVVILHEMENLTYDECAAVLRVPSGTVKSRLFYAFRQLRELIGDPR